MNAPFAVLRFIVISHILIRTVRCGLSTVGDLNPFSVIRIKIGASLRCLAMNTLHIACVKHKGGTLDSHVVCVAITKSIDSFPAKVFT